MSVHKRGRKGTHWNYYFRVRGVRYRGAIPEARTKWEAEQAESKIKQEIFEGRFGLVQSGTMKIADFIDEIYMPWAKANKRSWKGDECEDALHQGCPTPKAGASVSEGDGAGGTPALPVSKLSTNWPHKKNGRLCRQPYVSEFIGRGERI